MTQDNVVALIENPEVGTVKIVLEDSIHATINSGWSLIAILQGAAVRTIQVRKPGENGYAHTYADEAHEVTETRFVLRQTRDATIENLSEQLATMTSNLSSAKSDASASAKSVETLTKERDAAIEERKRVNSDRTFIREQLDRCRNTREKFEGDIGNYRDRLRLLEGALGKIRVREILGEDSP